MRSAALALAISLWSSVDCRFGAWLTVIVLTVGLRRAFCWIGVGRLNGETNWAVLETWMSPANFSALASLGVSVAQLTPHPGVFAYDELNGALAWVVTTPMPDGVHLNYQVVVWSTPRESPSTSLGTSSPDLDDRASRSFLVLVWDPFGPPKTDGRPRCGCGC